MSTEVDLAGVDPSHIPGVAEDNLIPGLVYCKRCCLLLASVSRGIASAGPVPCRGPAKLRPFESVFKPAELEIM